MPGDRVCPYPRLEADTALPLEHALWCITQLVSSESSILLEHTQSGRALVVLRNRAGVRLMRVVIVVEPGNTRTRIRTAVVNLAGASKPVQKMPSGPKGVEGLAIYRGFMRRLGGVLRDEDSTALCAIIEPGTGAGVFDIAGYEAVRRTRPSAPAPAPSSAGRSSAAAAPESAPELARASVSDVIDPHLAARLVVDATATQQHLADITAVYPALWSYVRVHPNCYPQLAEWIEHAQTVLSQGARRE